MSIRLAFALLMPVAVSVALGACSGQSAAGCPSSAFVAASSAPPLRVPEGLSIPDETDALRIPQVAGAEPSNTSAERCLETPPAFFEGAAANEPPSNAAPVEELSRRERRRREREAEAEQQP